MFLVLLIKILQSQFLFDCKKYQKNKRLCQLVDFIVGDAKTASYILRRKKIERFLSADATISFGYTERKKDECFYLAFSLVLIVFGLLFAIIYLLWYWFIFFINMFLLLLFLLLTNKDTSAFVTPP